MCAWTLNFSSAQVNCWVEINAVGGHEFLIRSMMDSSAEVHGERN